MRCEACHCQSEVFKLNCFFLCDSANAWCQEKYNIMIHVLGNVGILKKEWGGELKEEG